MVFHSWRTLAGPEEDKGRRGGKEKSKGGGWKRVEVKGRKVVILNPETLIYMKLVNYILWPDIFCHLEGTQKGVGCLIPRADILGGARRGEPVQ